LHNKSPVARSTIENRDRPVREARGRHWTQSSGDRIGVTVPWRGIPPMNVSLTPELEQLVNEKVESGLYQTASEVVREALRLLKARDDHAQLRADIQAGLGLKASMSYRLSPLAEQDLRP
jgi:putative addiction module CopG family antidote